MKTAALIREAKKRYPFLVATEIDIAAGYGIHGATGYKHASNSIYLDLKELREAYGTSRYLGRFGNIKTFEDFVLAVLLHEIAHVQQFQNGDPHELAVEYRTVFEAGTHDENLLEVVADQWARQEFKKWKGLNGADTALPN